MIDLSKRLKMVASLLGNGNVICDVGCDHAYLPIYLIESEAFSKAIAMDIRKGPLYKAKENITKNKMESLIDTRLSDGVKSLDSKEADALSICGMGGNVMMHIFDEGGALIKDIPTIVLQPQSEYMGFYNYLLLEGYRIVDELCTEDSGKFYFAWKVQYTGDKTNKLNDDIIKSEYFYSERLLRKRDEIYRDYLLNYCKSIEKAIDSLEKHSGDKMRLSRLKNEKEIIDNNIREYYNMS